MADCMNFPNDWAVFLEDYSFRDHKEFYTNGARLIPTFRVEQMLHHYLRKATEIAYKNGYEKGYADGKELLNAAIAGQETLQKHISQRWIPVTERLPIARKMIDGEQYYKTVAVRIAGSEVEAIAYYDQDEKRWFGTDDFPILEKVTYWYELPEWDLPQPPKGE